MSKLGKLFKLSNHDDDHYTALIERQQNTDKKQRCPQRYTFLPIQSTVAV